MRKTMARRVEAKGSWPGRGEKTQQPGFGKTLGAKLNAPGWHRKRWTMRSITAVALLGLWMGFSSAQVPTLNDLVSGKQAFIDRMHGFSAHLPPPWRAKVFGNAIILQDEGLHFIIIRGTRYDGNLKQVAQKWVEERERRIGFATRVAGNPPRFAFRQTQHGLVIYGEGLGYPYALDPQTSINFSFLAAGGLRLPDDYREVTAILPGETMAVLVTLLFPTESDDTSRKQMLDIVKSFRFLPLQERMGWHAKEVRDSETGLIAATMHVPEGFAFNAGIIRQGKKRRVAVFLRQGETMLRTDYVDLQTQIIQLPYGGNALSFLIINGQVSQQPQPIVVALAGRRSPVGGRSLANRNGHGVARAGKYGNPPAAAGERLSRRDAPTNGGCHVVYGCAAGIYQSCFYCRRRGHDSNCHSFRIVCGRRKSQFGSGHTEFFPQYGSHPHPGSGAQTGTGNEHL
ncbi:MAG: hypothetical protein KatS3mg131_2098 [Candidatus Tectimicrobiota bacterium]|nr:MAG: hypothetical protein KatS3mg131_2098 [Candidatus Tectomicrobia bacterium]